MTAQLKAPVPRSLDGIALGAADSAAGSAGGDFRETNDLYRGRKKGLTPFCTKFPQIVAHTVYGCTYIPSASPNATMILFEVAEHP